MYSLYDRVELVVEGVWRPGEGGEIMVPNGRTGTWTTYYNHSRSGISFRQVDSYLYSQYECGGVAVWRTGSVQETAHLYASRWHWWQKQYHLHKSHDVLFANEPSAQTARRGDAASGSAEYRDADRGAVAGAGRESVGRRETLCQRV